MPACAYGILRAANALRPLYVPPLGTEPLLTHVDWAYIIHYTKNVERLKMQQAQSTRLGLNVSVVVGYDAEAILADDRISRCMLWSGANMTAPYISQGIKLYIALFDMAHHGWNTALILEDDALVHWARLPMIDAAITTLNEGNGSWSVLYSGSWSRSGFDSLPSGLWPKDIRHVPLYRGPGQPMPLLGVVLSAHGARHLLSSLPIRDHVDLLVSDTRHPSGNQSGQYFVKGSAANRTVRWAFSPNLGETDAEAIACRTGYKRCTL